jgi:hypothetical protein
MIMAVDLKEIFAVRTAYNEDINPQKIYLSLDEAKAFCDKKAQYGYVVYNLEDKPVYLPFGTLMASKILYNAKKVADYVNAKGYKYGHAQINPAIDRGATEKIVSCDRFVGWALFDTGFSYNHLRKHGYTLYGPQNLENYLISMGFTRIDDINEVRGGDVMFVGVSDWFKSLPEDWKSYPDHTFICAGPSAEGRFFRYDGGSDKRLQSIQPLDEPLELPKKPFRFAYRAPEEIPNI